MTFEDYFAALIELYEPLHRKGPGSDEFSAKVACMLGLQKGAAIADLGCGTGAATFVLAKTVDASITALDLSPQYVALINNRSEELGYTNVSAVVGDMLNLTFDKKSLDCIWCDSSIYVVGFEAALKNWRPLLKEGGFIAASDVVWETNNPSKACAEFWAEEYPDMKLVETRRKQAQANGYRVVDVLEMPRSCWWENYYQPLEKRLDEVETQTGNSATMLAVIESTRREIDVFKRYFQEFGASFFILQVND
jgi:ubiquinone/menaquinone biosynthesis C-methylase UbiE